jgi:hypothetical protein
VGPPGQSAERSSDASQQRNEAAEHAECKAIIALGSDCAHGTNLWPRLRTETPTTTLTELRRDYSHVAAARSRY